MSDTVERSQVWTARLAISVAQRRLTEFNDEFADLWHWASPRPLRARWGLAGSDPWHTADLIDRAVMRQQAVDEALSAVSATLASFGELPELSLPRLPRRGVFEVWLDNPVASAWHRRRVRRTLRAMEAVWLVLHQVDLELDRRQSLHDGALGPG